MLDAQTAARWGAQPGFVQSLQRWTWCREALPALMQRLAANGAALPVVDRGGLAGAFWRWVATLEADLYLQSLDPVDFAHFEVGMLLGQLLAQRPTRGHGGDRAEEVRLSTDTALTLLAAWRTAIGAEPLDAEVPERIGSRWASYVENVTEDSGVAVAFLDVFTGREPVWQFPTIATERPLMRRAIQQRRAAV